MVVGRADKKKLLTRRLSSEPPVAPGYGDSLAWRVESASVPDCRSLIEAYAWRLRCIDWLEPAVTGCCTSAYNLTIYSPAARRCFVWPEIKRYASRKNR